MEITTHCTLCPRRCGADRTRTPGRCAGGGTVRVAHAAPHFWEEPCISGTRGSGTVFFGGCALGCLFCQNHAISGGAAGRRAGRTPPASLATFFCACSARACTT